MSPFSDKPFEVPAPLAAATSGAPETAPAALPPSAEAPASRLKWGFGLLRARGPRRDPWLWQGYLAPGSVTLLTSLWKSGKTTLVSVLLAKLGTGGRLAGLPLSAGRAVLVSEEDLTHWQLRDDVLHFGDHIGWALRPFQGKPTREQWEAFVNDLVAEHARQPFALLVIDPLADFIAGSENDAACVLRFLKPLQALTERGVAVLIVHHPGKDERPAGMAARGSGALGGAADILIEMTGYPGAAEDDRRRRLLAFSRYAATPRQLVIAWTADGTDYDNLGNFVEGEFAGSWPALRAMLAQAERKLTRGEIARRWPGDKKPSPTSLRRWLEQAEAQRLLARDGQGKRPQPYRYWLPERVPVWLQDPLNALHMPELFPRPAWIAARDAPAPTPPADLPQPT